MLSVRQQPGARRKGRSRERETGNVPTRHEPTCLTLKFAFAKKKSATLQFPGPLQIQRLPAWGTAEEMGFIRRHWLHRDGMGWGGGLGAERVAQFLQATEGTSLPLWRTKPAGHYKMAPGTVFKSTVVIRALRCTGLGSELDAPGKTYWQANMCNSKMSQNRRGTQKVSTDCCPPLGQNSQNRIFKTSYTTAGGTRWESNKFANTCSWLTDTLVWNPF